MRYISGCLLVLTCLFGWIVAVAQASGATQGEPPRDVGLVEQTGRRLVQLDVSIEGPAEVIADLSAEDFQLTVGKYPVEKFFVDRVCRGQRVPENLAGSPVFAQAEKPAQTLVSVSYLFYFDHNHLTFEGRRRSLEIARSLIPQLIHAPNRAMIVASGKKVEALTSWTSDPSELMDALDHLEQHPEQGDVYAMREDERVLHVQQTLEDGLDQAAGTARLVRMQSALIRGAMVPPPPPPPPDERSSSFNSGYAAKAYEATDRKMSAGSRKVAAQTTAEVERMRKNAQDFAKDLARIYRTEEKWHTERALTRFSLVLSRMSTLPPPKAAIYFADRMRANAGEHYVEMFRDWDERDHRSNPKPQATRVISYDTVINEAAAHGVRLYTVQAEGIVSDFRTVPTSAQTLHSGVDSIQAANQRFQDARSSLATFAHETGGKTFLHGASTDEMVTQLHKDLDCFYVLSFDSTGLPEDKTMPVLLHVTRPDVSASFRTRLVIQSEVARRENELTAAFVAPEEVHSGPPLRGTVIPLGFENGKFSALVQVAMPGSTRPDATWDMGLSVISGSRAPWKASERLLIASPEVPVILEVMTTFDPGPYELVFVSRELDSEMISAGHLEGEWPQPRDAVASIGPIALLQPGNGAFVRNGEVRRTGSQGQGTLARTELPTALIGIVCHPRKGNLIVERELVGSSSATFPSMEVAGTKDRCSVFSDTIPADTMTSGSFRYEVRVLRDGEEEASRDRSFVAVTKADVAATAGASR